MEEKSEINMDNNPSRIYHEPTWTLRITMFLAYYGIFMSLAVSGVFIYARADFILIVIPPILLQIWMVKGLGQYNQRARRFFSVFSGLVIFLCLLWYAFDTDGTTIVGWTIFLISTYCFYGVVFHRETIELFSGKYQREPDYYTNES